MQTRPYIRSALAFPKRAHAGNEMLSAQAVEPCQLPKHKQPHRRLVDFRRAQDGSQRENLWCLKEEPPSARCAFSPQGLKASILMPQSTQSHTHPSCMVSVMDCANAWICSNRENNNADFIFTEVSIISVSTKQMSLTLEASKYRSTPQPFKSQHLVTSIKLTGKMLVSSQATRLTNNIHILMFHRS